MLIRIARPEDDPAIWSIIEPVIRAGETYTLDRDMTREDVLAYWLSRDKETFVAEEDGMILGAPTTCAQTKQAVAGTFATAAL